MQDYIISTIESSIQLQKTLLEDKVMLENIQIAAYKMAETLKSGGKILLCGNGGSAADSQHIAAELIGRFECERAGLPAIALTTDSSILTAVGNDYGYDSIFDRQVQALGNSGDILIGITTSGNSKNIESALKRAKEKGLITIGLLGGSGGTCKQYCDHSFVINSSRTARIQEQHILIGHILCGIVEKTL